MMVKTIVLSISDEVGGIAMKKKIIGLISAVLVTGALAGCGASEGFKEGLKEGMADSKAESTTETKQEDNNVKLRFGELLEVNESDDKVVVKAKIEPSISNKTTIDQNGYNVEDLILNQGFDKYNEIQYWAVADMTDGEESKAISFTLNKDLITKIKNEEVVGNQIIDNANDVYILPSLKE